jgi:dGTPase
LASTIKYLCTSPDKDKQFSHKVGFFETEKDLIQKIWEKLGLKINKNGIPMQRHPFTFIMEAADDIAYSVHDIEDAIEKRVVVAKDFFDAMNAENEGVQAVFTKMYQENPKDDEFLARYSEFTRFRIKLIRDLFISNVIDNYIENEGHILSGEFEGSLLEAEEESKITKDFLQSFARKNVYTSHEAVDIELSGHKIIHEILDNFIPLLRLSEKDFQRLESPQALKYGELVLERRLYSLLPNKHLLTYKYFSRQNPDLEIVHRTHLIIDYLSGMTDNHAVKVFNGLQGISTAITI